MPPALHCSLCSQRVGAAGDQSLQQAIERLHRPCIIPTRALYPATRSSTLNDVLCNGFVAASTKGSPLSHLPLLSHTHKRTHSLGYIVARSQREAEDLHRGDTCILQLISPHEILKYFAGQLEILGELADRSVKDVVLHHQRAWYERVAVSCQSVALRRTPPPQRHPSEMLQVE